MDGIYCWQVFSLELLVKQYKLHISILETKLWIGANKHSGSWHWLDESPFAFTNWNVIATSNYILREPSGDGTFMEMFSNGKWNDLPDSEDNNKRNHVVCQGMFFYSTMQCMFDIV